MPNEQARRLLFLLFPTDVTESVYRLFGDIVAAARTQLSVELLKRQAAAMDAWHRNGVASQLRQIRVPVLLATGTEDLVIPASNALKLANAIPGAWLAQFSHRGHAFMAQYPRALADLINSFLAVVDPRRGRSDKRLHTPVCSRSIPLVLFRNGPQGRGYNRNA